MWPDVLFPDTVAVNVWDRSSGGLRQRERAAGALARGLPDNSGSGSGYPRAATRLRRFYADGFPFLRFRFAALRFCVLAVRRRVLVVFFFMGGPL